MGSLRQSPYTEIENISFKIYSNIDVGNLSVVEITNHISRNALGNHLDNGLYDLRMGPINIEANETCKTCFKNFMLCSGHFGHINLPGPVFNPCFFQCIFQLMSRICYRCFRFQATSIEAIKFIYEMKFLAEGHLDLAVEVQQIYSSIINGGSEAVEDNSYVYEENKASLNTAAMTSLRKNVPVAFTLNLKHKLDKIFKEATKDKLNTKKTSTSLCNKIHSNIVKNFLVLTGKNKTCLFCATKLLVIQNIDSQMMIKSSQAKLKIKGRKQPDDIIDPNQPYITADQCRTIFRKSLNSDSLLLKKLFPVLETTNNEFPVDLLFLEKILVTPPKTRPYQKVANKVAEHEKSNIYSRILMRSFCLKVLKPFIERGTEQLSELPDEVTVIMNEFKGETIAEKSLTIFHTLQLAINSLFDAKLNTKESTVSSKGLRQVIEKKFGLFRQNLMGKRVNYSARSVAAPDPMLAGDEVGVPLDFALKLTFPEFVNSFNVEKLRTLVVNGPNTHPGAVFIEDEEGKKVFLKADDRKQRVAIANTLLTPTGSSSKRINGTKIVYRHLQNGDFVLMNRQPTLHRPSIQAHKARVMPVDRVLRMPYVNCKAYNADFDGDELNLHFPQSFDAQSEASNLLLTHNHYLTPKDGSPLAGLIQDCVVSSVLLTMRGNFFIREDYQQLVYVSISNKPGKIFTLPPAIVKPDKLWSGKQVISTIIHNIIPASKSKPSLNFKTSVKVDMWQREEPRQWKAGGTPEQQKEGMSESELVVMDGELLCGVIDKCAIGSTTHGLIHTCYDLYGGKVACDLLTAINRLSIEYLKWSGHTISLKEFVTPIKASKRRRKELSHLVKRAKGEVAAKLDLKEENLSSRVEYFHSTGNEVEMAVVDAAYTSVLGPTISRVTSENEKSLYRNNLNNNMRMMVDTGAKGSKVNMNQMASLFGCVAIDGKRMPMSVTGKTLPSFSPYECDPRAGGFIPNRFVTGMDPKSYFFLCIVGRDSLQHTAVKTANSGYMQRCLIKHLEGITVLSDETVRNSDGLVLQFAYGEDGQDVMKMSFLTDSKSIDTLVKNYKLINMDQYPTMDPKDVKSIHKLKKQIKKHLTKTQVKKRTSAFLRFSQENQHVTGYNNQGHSKLSMLWINKSDIEKQNYNIEEKKCPDPLVTKYSSSSSIGVVAEALENLIDGYYDSTYSKKPSNQKLMEKSEIQEVLYKKAQTSRVVPGEPVGALCAQAIGEPLTQMTLNTFHFAGRDELNVTLGVPRMIEILRTASDHISTPIMEVPFLPGVSKSAAEALRNALTPVELHKVVHNVQVTASLEKKQYDIYRKFIIKFNFLPHKEYKKEFSLTPEQILRYMEKTFFKSILIKQIKNALNKIHVYESTSRVKRMVNEDAVSDDDEGNNNEMMQKIDPNKEDLSSDEEEKEEEDADSGLSSLSRQKKNLEQDYSEEEDEEESNDEAQEVKEEVEIKKEETTSTLEQMDIRNLFKPKKEKVFMTENDCRFNHVLGIGDMVVDYTFDEEKSEWCQITLNLPIAEGKYDLASILRSVLHTTYIYSVQNIKKAFVVENDDCYMLRTEGVNIMKITHYNTILDVNKIYTNNIHIMKNIYGIEAAQRAIIKEIRSVQSAYSIQVDFRHLSLLCDYFTCEGVYKACSRSAIYTCASPIQKMSYETCFSFLREAVLHGKVDTMNSPSSNVMIGQPVKVGSSTIDIFTQFVPCGKA